MERNCNDQDQNGNRSGRQGSRRSRETAPAIRLRSHRIHGDRQRPRGSPPGLRQCDPADGGQRAGSIRGRRTFRARCPLAALDPHGRDLPARESQASLLPVDGVSHRPIARQQRHESTSRSTRRAGGQAEERRLAWTARRGARRGPGQRRARTAGSMLPRLDGDDAAPGHGLWAALRGALRDTLLTHGDHYMHLADLKSYLEADQKLVELYTDLDGWARKAILNVASAGKFSSDRTIAEYATDIWKVKPCPVS